MTLDYAENRIKQALKLTHGNVTRARQQIIAWTYEDAKLLQALTRHHMTGIVAHAINRVLARSDTDQPMPEPPQDREKDTFGMEILKSIADGESPRFGQENAAMPVPRKTASQSHIDAIRLLAAKGKSSSKNKT